MKYKISKELFEAVMGDESIEFKKCMYSQVDYIHIDAPDFKCRENINDFFFACKEWALENSSYTAISSGVSKNGGYCILENNNRSPQQFYRDSEQQAVFDACEWVLSNQCSSRSIADFNEVVKSHNLKRFSSAWSDNDLELPYVFDLLWDIKSIGHLINALENDYLHAPSKDIYSTMKEYGLNEHFLNDWLLGDKSK